jgi:hypothetical protein
VIVELGTDLTQLIPDVFLSAAASIDPPGSTLQDFTNPFTYTVTSENGQTVKEWVVTVNITNAISEHEMPEIVLYPNPTQGKLQITIPITIGTITIGTITIGTITIGNKSQINSKLQIQKIEVIDLYGNVLKINDNRTIEQWNNESIECDISDFPSGIYFIRIYLESQTIVKKIIKL